MWKKTWFCLLLSIFSFEVCAEPYFRTNIEDTDSTGENAQDIREQEGGKIIGIVVGSIVGTYILAMLVGTVYRSITPSSDKKNSLNFAAPSSSLQAGQIPVIEI